MGLNLKAKPTRERSSGENSGTQNVLMVMGKRNGEHAICTLAVDSFGLPAGTEVALVLREINQDGKKKKRPEIKDFKVGGKLGTSPVLGENIVVVAQNSYLDRNQTIEGLPVVNARWINIGIHDYDPDVESTSNVAPGFVMVEPIYPRTVNNEEFLSQKRHVIDPSLAFSFSSVAEFKENAVPFLELDPPAELVVRVTDRAAALSGNLEPGETSVESKRLFLKWDKTNAEKPGFMSAADSIDVFLAEEDGRWMGFIEAIATGEAAGYEFDVMVDRPLGIGKATAEKIVENTETNVDRAKAKKGAELSKYEQNAAGWAADGSDTFYENGERVYTMGVNFVKTTPQGRNIVTDTFAQSATGALFTLEELPGARSEELQAKFNAQAVARGAARAERFKKGRDASKDQSNAQEEERYAENQGGLTPS